MKYRSRKKLVTICKVGAIKRYIKQRVKNFELGEHQLPYSFTQFQLMGDPSYQKLHWN